MDIRAMREAFRASGTVHASVLERFTGVDGHDVYNCSVPFVFDGKEYIYGRVERRGEWATSRVMLFERAGEDEWARSGDIEYVLEDPFVQMVRGEFVLGGTFVTKDAAGEVIDYCCHFYRGADLFHLKYFAHGPAYMKDIRLIELRDGRVGVFSRPRSEEIRVRLGSCSAVGFAVIDSLDALTPEVIGSARFIDGLFDANEWGGCNQCYPLSGGRVGVIRHKSYMEPRDGVDVSVYLNIAFVFDPATHTVSGLKVIGDRQTYPDAPAKRPDLVDCAFTSGIVEREDGFWDLYSGIGDTHEGRAVITYPFE